jgi:glycerophosphoryl diester phosphodiesterase
MVEIVAHRGAPGEWPENTLPAFERAIALGADNVELDVRLSRDGVPVVYHWTYLQELTTLSGPVFDYTASELRQAVFVGENGRFPTTCFIPTLDQLLAALGGRIGLEIELKGPEPEAAQQAAAVLLRNKGLWERIEVTSYEACPGLATDLLFPRSEPWMGLDVVAYNAAQMGRLARATAVHLHPTQLFPQVVDRVRASGMAVHAWDVNDAAALQIAFDLGIPRLCTDRLQQALDFRAALSA